MGIDFTDSNDGLHDAREVRLESVLRTLVEAADDALPFIVRDGRPIDAEEKAAAALRDALARARSVLHWTAPASA